MPRINELEDPTEIPIGINAFRSYWRNMSGSLPFWCRKRPAGGYLYYLLERPISAKPSDSMDSYCNVEVSESANAEFIMEDTKEEISQNDAYGEVTQCKQTAQGAKKAALQIDEENLQTDCISMDSMDDCISETVYSQSSQYSEWQDSQESPSRKRKIALNTFLETVDISPVKKTLTVDFDLASERT
ncbi:unnamed protein product [Mytilus coruscus]|uniref:Uncharacterized protein n=1 Tax=Mytilus coruscus TaxID=42192 RepID=A0A6J8EB94_MYTCO|nr:unnamed protein product [Mytilus coruscus]